MPHPDLLKYNCKVLFTAILEQSLESNRLVRSWQDGKCFGMCGSESVTVMNSANIVPESSYRPHTHRDGSGFPRWH